MSIGQTGGYHNLAPGLQLVDDGRRNLLQSGPMRTVAANSIDKRSQTAVVKPNWRHRWTTRHPTSAFASSSRWSAVNSQREMEQAVAKAVAAGAIAGTETLAATMTLEIPALRLKVKFDGDIELQ